MVVNYTVKAICEFFYFPTLLEDMFQKDSANRREVLQETAVKMSQLINVDKLKQLESREMAMSAYAAIAEGVLYLRRGAFKEWPSFSGKHIKDTIKQLDENSQLFADTIYINGGQTDYWLAQDDRLAKIEDAWGVAWRKIPPLSRADAEQLVKSLSPYIARLRADFAADFPLNFHFVGDQNRFYFLNCRLTESILPPKDDPENLYCVCTMDDLKG